MNEYQIIGVHCQEAFLFLEMKAIIKVHIINLMMNVILFVIYSCIIPKLII